MTAPTTDRALDSWALVQRAQAGDRDAFAEIYRQNRSFVYQFTLKRVHNVDLAEDITQDTFIRALKRIGSFTWQGRDFLAWLYTIARNLVADYFKSGRYRLEWAGGAPLDLAEDRRDDTHGVERQVEAAADSAHVLATLVTLTERQRQALILHHLNGLSMVETSRLMGDSETVTKSLLFRARRAMGRALTEAHGEPS